MLVYEQHLKRDKWWGFKEGSMHFEKESAVHKTLQRIARSALVEHQRYLVIGEDILGMQRQPRNQQDWRSVGVTGDINQGAIGVAAPGHQRCQRALAAASEQRAGEPGRIEISGRLHGS